MSAELKDLIRRLVRSDTKKRLSAASALNHDWFDMDFSTAQKEGEQKLNHIKSVLQSRSIRKSIIGGMALDKISIVNIADIKSKFNEYTI
jgi:serine/threonine protein kinase